MRRSKIFGIFGTNGGVVYVFIATKRYKSGHRFWFCRFINVNDINQLVSNLRTAWMGGFHLFADVAKYGRTYNRPVERSGDGKPSVGSNSQSVSINENVFQSFNSYAKAVLGNKSVDMSGKYDDCIDLDGKERSILAKVKDLSVISELLKHMSSEGFDDVGLRYVGGRWVWLEFDSMDQVERDRVGLPLASWAPEVYKKLGGRWGSSVFTDMVSDGPMSHGKSIESNPLRKDAEGHSLDESLENKEHLDVDSCDSDSPKNVNNDSVSPSSRVLREEDVRGVEKFWNDDDGEDLGSSSQDDCDNVTTDDNEDCYAKSGSGGLIILVSNSDELGFDKTMER
ncbi:hypothetical protein Tco_0503327 [Tanacetum coccineum]